MRVGTSAFLLAAMISTTASAQSVQPADEIVKFFANAVDLGAARGICVGTEEECREKAEAVESQAGLDMLINFDLDSAELTPDARAKLSEFAKALQDNRLKAHTFVVEGHTDALGADTYNDELSRRRAQSVTAFLLATGVDANRIDAVGMGEAKPRTPDPYDAVNRRVEMRIDLQ